MQEQLNQIKSKAESLDLNDSLKSFRDKFYIPLHHGKEVKYFTGNSLGLQPKSVMDYIQIELDAWKTYGVEAHFMGKNPWMYYHKMFAEPLSKLVGANPKEVVAMNTLTVNLHLLMVSFYQPKGVKRKILMEGGAFPSDQYAIETQVKFHGGDPSRDIIELIPRSGEDTLRTEDILQAIEDNKDELALILFGGVNYYTGQLFDIQSITNKAKEYQIICGFDLAHAAGNAELHLHDWGVDFACWCSYKYLNSGPGGVGGVFVHEKWHKNTEINRFAGWWGHQEETRFKMQKGFIPMESAEAWQCSNAQVFSMAIHKASLDIFMEAGFSQLKAKSRSLTGLLWQGLQLILENQSANPPFRILTPPNPMDNGAQISLLWLNNEGKSAFNQLTEAGIITDWREPNVIRVAPVPLYNTYNDVYFLIEKLSEILAQTN